MATSNQTNGANGKVVWWILQVVFGLLVMAGGAWATSLQHDIDKIDIKVENLRDKYDKIAPDLASIKARIDGVDRRLASIDRKLDYLPKR